MCSTKRTSPNKKSNRNNRHNRCETGTAELLQSEYAMTEAIIFYRKCLFSLYLQLISHPTYLSDI